VTERANYTDYLTFRKLFFNHNRRQAVKFEKRFTNESSLGVFIEI